jgi:hypothetical protein
MRAAYIVSFKKNTWKRVFQETVSVELLSAIIETFLDKTVEITDAAIKSLHFIFAMSTIEFTLLLLPAKHACLLRQLAHKVHEHKGDTKEVEELRCRIEQLLQNKL